MPSNVIFAECEDFEGELLNTLDPDVIVLRGDNVPELRSIARLLEKTHPRVIEYVSVLRHPTAHDVPRRCVYYWILTKSWIKKKSINIPYKYASGFFGGYTGKIRAFGALKTRDAVNAAVELARLFLSKRPSISDFLQESRRLLDSGRDGAFKEKPAPLRSDALRFIDIDRGIADWCFIMLGAGNTTLLKEDGSALNHIFYFVTRWLQLCNRAPVYYWRMRTKPSVELLKELNVTINNV